MSSTSRITARLAPALDAVQQAKAVLEQARKHIPPGIYAIVVERLDRAELNLREELTARVTA
jgi:hypothetical protein